MRITIEPTENDDRPTTSLSLPSDDLTAPELLELFLCAMVALGYAASSVFAALEHALEVR